MILRRGAVQENDHECNTHKREKKVRFTFPAPPERDVGVAGTFNDWQPETAAMAYRSEEDVHEVRLPLDRGGRYEYTFVVDGRWCIDPECDEVSANAFGSLNGVIRT